MMVTALALGALVACSPRIPDSAAGVGFDSPQAQQARDAALSGQALPPPGAVSSEVLPPAGGAAAASNDTILEAAAALDATTANSGVPPVQASPSNPAPVVLNNPGISDENDFEAVAARETIQSDAQRIAQNRAQYQVIAPTAVPNRPGDDQANIVQYALRTSHPVGVKLYARPGLAKATRSRRNCAAFASADQAQIAFLQRGGPERDRGALDPDGDGYACGWDPRPFRAAVAGTQG